MSKRVKVTQYKKKYTDKKTGEHKEVTINNAKVVDRLLEFRKDNPRGIVDTSYTIENDRLIFKTHIVKDKSDKFSAEATGHAMAEFDGGEKQFEKLETISVGRALALLGYTASGEIASFEEMEEFAKYRDERIDDIIVIMNQCNTMDELKKYFMSLNSYQAESRIIEAKDKRKAELQDADS
jgi:hypothetical protein